MLLSRSELLKLLLPPSLLLGSVTLLLLLAALVKSPVRMRWKSALRRSTFSSCAAKWLPMKSSFRSGSCSAKATPPCKAGSTIQHELTMAVL